MAEALSPLIPRIQTRFTPARSGMGILMFLGTVLLVLSLVALGGVFFYKRFLQQQIDDLSKSLKRLEADFDPALIQEFLKISKAIDASKAALAGHRSMSNLFDFLEENTLRDVRFASFAFTEKETSLTMAGEARSYTTLAQQASLLERSPLVRKISLSNLALKETGSISFTVDVKFDPMILSFR